MDWEDWKRIVIKVRASSERCRLKALKAAVVDGVSSVKIGGRERDHVVVTGNGINCTKLTKNLRRKMRHAEIVTVHDVRDELIAVRPQRFEYSPYTTRGYPYYQPYYGPSMQYTPYDKAYDHKAYNPQPVYESEPGSCTIM